MEIENFFEDQILACVKEQPMPSFFVAKQLQLPYERVNSCLNLFAQKGIMSTFELSLLGKKEIAYFRA